ncbi:MAG: substrate-binding domain-containing protein [Gulosibacter sp.]|uniref:substrate-binding domain-containing protein n=1 Tax=Gulosibacter sp. TaxID=2817531 RepID=UPI003F9045CD
MSTHMSAKRFSQLLATAAVATLALVGCASGGSNEAGPEHTGDVPSWCGPEETSLALLDGFGGNGWRVLTAAAGEQEAAKCPSVTSFEYADGQGDTQKAISDIQGMVATGVGALVIFPDAGEAVLPAIRSAYDAGVVTVPYRADPGGEAGVDYDAWIGADFTSDGVAWGTWIAEQFPDGANILFVGGPAGSSQGNSEREGLESVLTDDKYVMIGEQPFEVTNWDPSTTQQVLTAAINKYPEIDVIISDFGPSMVGALPAFAENDRSIPALVTSDGNVLGCFFEENKDANPDFQLMTVETGVDNARLAVQHAVALATGGTPPEETTFQAEVFEDSTSDDKPVQCESDLPDDIYLSSEMSGEEQAALIK